MSGSTWRSSSIRRTREGSVLELVGSRMISPRMSSGLIVLCDLRDERLVEVTGRQPLVVALVDCRPCGGVPNRALRGRTRRAQRTRAEYGGRGLLPRRRAQLRRP